MNKFKFEFVSQFNSFHLRICWLSSTSDKSFKTSRNDRYFVCFVRRVVAQTEKAPTVACTRMNIIGSGPPRSTRTPIAHSGYASWYQTYLERTSNIFRRSRMCAASHKGIKQRQYLFLYPNLNLYNSFTVSQLGNEKFLHSRFKLNYFLYYRDSWEGGRAERCHSMCQETCASLKKVRKQ